MTNIYVKSGDAYLSGGALGDRRILLTITKAGALRDLTGVDLTFMVKRRPSDADEDALITKVTPTEIALAADQTTTGKGLAYLSLEEADTASLLRRYRWELQAEDAAGPITLAGGGFYVEADLIEGA